MVDRIRPGGMVTSSTRLAGSTSKHNNENRQQNPPYDYSLQKFKGERFAQINPSFAPSIAIKTSLKWN